MSTASPTTWAERLSDLGNIPASRIVSNPSPGSATLQDLIELQNEHRRICELVDGTLVEKMMGWQESLLAGVLIHWLHTYLETHHLGVVTGPDGLVRLFEDTVRGPDVAFVAWNRLPDRRIPLKPVPDVVPNFVIEILSSGNTYSEMSRKRREYFHAGVQLIWMIEPRDRTVAVFRSSTDVKVVREGGIITGEQVLPDWTINTADLFARLDERGE